MPRSLMLSLLLAVTLALPACFTARRSADVDRTPKVDTGMGAAILMPGDNTVRMPAGTVAPGGTQQTRVGPEGSSSSRGGNSQPSTGELTMIGGSKIDENRHELGREDPVVQKVLMAPFAAVAAPFVWAAEKLRGDPEAGPQVPSASKPGPPPAPPVADYETNQLREMEREIAERNQVQRAEAAHGRRSSIADELAALERRPATPAPAPKPTAPAARPARPAADGVVDRDGDGRVDEWIYREAGVVTRRSLDRDGDGRVDSTVHYDTDNHEITRVEDDENGDGVNDTFTAYRNGRVARRRADANGDGEIDTWSFYAEGRITRHEQDTTGDGFRDRVGHYDGDRLAREEYDRDGDGLTDAITHYDRDERITRREEDVDRDGHMDVISHYENGRLARKEILDARDRAVR